MFPTYALWVRRGGIAGLLQRDQFMLWWTGGIFVPSLYRAFSDMTELYIVSPPLQVLLGSEPVFLFRTLYSLVRSQCVNLSARVDQDKKL